MFDWLRSIWRSRIGRIGTLIVLLKPVYEAISLLGNLDFVLGYVGPILNFLDSVWGTFSLVALGFVLIYKASREQLLEDEETHTETLPKKETEQLRSENRRLRAEKSQLEAELKTENKSSLTKAGLLAIEPTSPKIDLSDVDLPRGYLINEEVRI